ncbi:MAG: hypothetical protein ABMA64_14965, partial [Myxococcota bacterium]
PPPDDAPTGGGGKDGGGGEPPPTGGGDPPPSDEDPGGGDPCPPNGPQDRPGHTGPFPSWVEDLADILTRLLDDARNVSDGPEDPFLDDTEFGDADELDWDDPRPDVGQDATPTAPEPGFGDDTPEVALTGFEPYAIPVLITQLDGPEPGPADLLALEVAIEIWLVLQLWNALRGGTVLCRAWCPTVNLDPNTACPPFVETYAVGSTCPIACAKALASCLPTAVGAGCSGYGPLVSTACS